MWDCNAFLSRDLFHELQALEPPLKAIAISHPHVRSTSFLRHTPYPLLTLSSGPSVLLDKSHMGTVPTRPTPHR
jgi:hypothetical protein